MPPVRRLTAILAADVAGYSRLMGADEEGTHERLKAHLGELVNPKIEERRGRIVKNTGDGFLAEFASVVDAVRCAVEVQRGMAEHNAETLADQRIEFRIGVNLGDVIAEEQDIFGDGVNIAARLEALAEPGGICISRVVRDQVRDKLDYTFEDLGEQNVKNIARPVRVYRVFDRAAESQDPAVQAATLITQTFIAPRLSLHRATPINCRPALHEPQRRPGAAIFRGWYHRGSDDRPISYRWYVGDLAKYCVHLPEQAHRNEADRSRVAGTLCARRKRPPVRQPGSRQAQLIDAESDTHVWAERFSGEISDCSRCKTRSPAG